MLVNIQLQFSDTPHWLSREPLALPDWQITGYNIMSQKIQLFLLTDIIL
jgi:hypothetical protein